jgi:pyruvate dehydrogenase (quinone)
MGTTTKASGLDRRGFFQAATVASLAAMTPRTALGEISETTSAVTFQPTPSPSDDQNTSDILVETLIDWGATHVFGIVGDGINSIAERPYPLCCGPP